MSTSSAARKPYLKSENRELFNLEKSKAQAWFSALRNDICAELERIEDELKAGPMASQAAASFASHGNAPTIRARTAAAAPWR